MGKRRLSRETALQALYLADVSHLSPEDAFAAMARGKEPLDEDAAAFAKGIVDGTRARLAEIDGRIQDAAVNWELRRMAAVDRNILRLAAFELLYSDTPPSVVIDEAIEISKKFVSEDSPRFVNGILDKIKSRGKSPA